MSTSHHKIITCAACKKSLPASRFYQASKASKSGRASPYCIDCNSVAVLRQKYRRDIRTHGVKAFAEKIRTREAQVDLMTQTLASFGVQK
jgi:hypothetical protein